MQVDDSAWGAEVPGRKHEVDGDCNSKSKADRDGNDDDRGACRSQDFPPTRHPLMCGKDDSGASDDEIAGTSAGGATTDASCARRDKAVEVRQDPSTHNVDISRSTGDRDLVDETAGKSQDDEPLRSLIPNAVTSRGEARLIAVHSESAREPSPISDPDENPTPQGEPDMDREPVLARIPLFATHRTSVIKAPRAFSRAAALAAEEKDILDKDLGGREWSGRGISGKYDYRMGMLQITNGGRCIPKMARAEAPAPLGKTHAAEFAVDDEHDEMKNEDDDDDDDDEDDDETHWECYDGSMASLVKVTFTPSWAQSPACFGRSQRQSTTGDFCNKVSDAVRKNCEPPRASMTAVRCPAQWMTPVDVGDILGRLSGWRDGSSCSAACAHERARRSESLSSWQQRQLRRRK